MPYCEDDLLPISALQHLQFCPRRCALIHIEGMWTENAMTAEGRLLHERAHTVSGTLRVPMEDGTRSVPDTLVRIARGLRLCSRELGLFGVADIVEFHRLADVAPSPPAWSDANAIISANWACWVS
jgi:CRISPR-associated exonuclease Cas4